MIAVTNQIDTIDPRQYLEKTVEELEQLAVFAKATNKHPVVVLVDGSSPWATRTKILLSEISIRSHGSTNDNFLKGCSDWKICEIAAKSAPTIAEHLLATPTESSKVRIVMFYQTNTGLRIACTDICLSDYLYH